LALFRFVICMLAFAICGVTQSLTLANMSLDWHVNNADAIVIAKVRQSDGKTFLDIEADLLRGTTKEIEVIADSCEREGYWKREWERGAKGLFFLSKSKVGRGDKYSLLQCWQGQIWFRSDEVVDRRFSRYTSGQFRTLIDQFVAVRLMATKENKISALVAMLDADDPHVLTAVSNSLELVVNARERAWKIQTPNTSDWSYEEYYQRNAFADKAEWLKWWTDRKMR
jgi:hypothetical protein